MAGAGLGLGAFTRARQGAESLGLERERLGLVERGQDFRQVNELAGRAQASINEMLTRVQESVAAGVPLERMGSLIRVIRQTAQEAQNTLGVGLVAETDAMLEAISRAPGPVEQGRLAGQQEAASLQAQATELQKFSGASMTEVLQGLDVLPSDAGGGAGGFGNSLVGRSIDLAATIQLRRQQGARLTPKEELDEQFALSVLQRPQDFVRTDPVTGQQSIVTVRPIDLPQVIAAQQQIQTGQRVTTEALTEEQSAKKVRIDAAKIETDLSKSLTKLDDLISFVRANPRVIGTRGQVLKILSGVSGQLGGPTDPAAKRFAVKIEALRSDLRVLIDTGRFSDQDREILNRLVSGTGLLDSAPDTLASYADIRNTILTNIEEAKRVQGKGGRVVDFKDLPK